MNYEFFTTPERVFTERTHFYDGPNCHPLTDLDDNQIRIIVEQLRENKAAERSLHYLQQKGWTSLRAKLTRFAICNFGNLDRVPDITDTEINFERVECGMRSTCKERGIVCILK